MEKETKALDIRHIFQGQTFSKRENSDVNLSFVCVDVHACMCTCAKYKLLNIC